MAQIGPRKRATRVAPARWIERPGVVGMAGVLDVQKALARENPPVPCVTGRHDAVEHVHTGRHGFEQVEGGPDAHQVLRPLGRQQRRRVRDHLVHTVGRLADAQPANRIAVEANLHRQPGTGLAELEVGSALHDAELDLAFPKF